MNTLENNRLIAKFMGMTCGYPNDDSVMIQATLRGNEVVPIESMQYHSSWDWLVPVVEKIENLNTNNDEYYTDFYFQATNFVQNYTASFIDRNNLEIAHCDSETRIGATYNAVVEFIKWYNEQN